MIIEFAGIPGSGKSTMARAIAARGAPARSAKVLRASRRDVVRHPLSIAWQLVRWDRLRRQWVDRSEFMTLLRRRISQDRLIRSARSTLLLEEGVAHHVWRELFLFPHLVTEPWHPFVAQQHPLVVLQADRETLRNRIRGKSTQPPANAYLASLSPDDPEWERAISTYETVLQAAGRHRPVLRIDAVGEQHVVAERIEAGLSELA